MTDMTDMTDMKNMTDMTVAELKANFSEVLHRVQDGAEYRILYGRSHRPVARLAPLEELPPMRKMGVLKGKASLGDDIYKFKSTEEFLGLETAEESSDLLS